MVFDEERMSAATKGNLCATSWSSASAGTCVAYRINFWSVFRWHMNSTSFAFADRHWFTQWSSSASSSSSEQPPSCVSNWLILRCDSPY